MLIPVRQIRSKVYCLTEQTSGPIYISATPSLYVLTLGTKMQDYLKQQSCLLGLVVNPFQQ